MRAVAGSKKRERSRPSRGRPRTLRPRQFYEEVLNEAERLELERARELEGLDDEIALLRLRLRKALAEHPEDMQLMLKGVDMLVKAVSARYRLSKEARGDLADSLVGVLKGIGGQLYPEVFGDGQ